MCLSVWRSSTFSLAFLLCLPTGSASTALGLFDSSLYWFWNGKRLHRTFMLNLVIDSVPLEKSGMAAGINNAFHQLRISFGIAFLGALIQIKYSHDLSAGLAAIAAHNAASPSGALLTGQFASLAKRLTQAGTFVGSTGLRNPSQAFSWVAQLPLFSSIQLAVQTAFSGWAQESFCRSDCYRFDRVDLRTHAAFQKEGCPVLKMSEELASSIKGGI